MPRLGPIKRDELIACLRRLGFDGPFPGSKHALMVKGQRRVRIPNPHRADISRDLVARILRQAGIDRDEWERL
ncbi:MAG TPA: type II toxin-antitoxin system HicA family toxin [Chloroflexota bacterium]|nr:type II toxin-antitoxin system HicA family toxin [Chloroflexota bacterium]